LEDVAKKLIWGKKNVDTSAKKNPEKHLDNILI
jgi:hypothetical protein